MTNAPSSFVNSGNTMAHMWKVKMAHFISLGRDNKQGAFEGNVVKPETYSFMVSTIDTFS